MFFQANLLSRLSHRVCRFPPSPFLLRKLEGSCFFFLRSLIKTLICCSINTSWVQLNWKTHPINGHSIYELYRRDYKESKPVAIKPAQEPQRKYEIHSLSKYLILVRCGDWIDSKTFESNTCLEHFKQLCCEDITIINESICSTNWLIFKHR